MRLTPKTADLNSQALGLLLTPSWLAAVVSLVVSIAACVATIVLVAYRSSSLRLDFIDYQAGNITEAYHSFSDKILSNTLVGNLPLYLFWGLIGFIVYVFSVNLLSGFRLVANLPGELKYVHASRRQLIWQPAEHLLVRLAVLAAWVPYTLFFMHRLLPYTQAASVAGSAPNNVLMDGLYALLAIIILAVALFLHVVLLRLFLLRPRLFSNDWYKDVKSTSDVIKS